MFAMTRWNPIDELTTLHRDMDRVFDRMWGVTGRPTSDGVTGPTGAFVPATEIGSDENAWHLRVALPGIDPKDVQIDVTGHVLSISGERRQETRTGQDSSLSEITYGRFDRRFTLPERVDVDKVEATFSNGMLELTLPLQESAKPRRITVKENGHAITA